MMKELVLLKNDEAFTNSLIIAEGAGVEHRALIQLISLHIDDVSEFGRVTFEMLPFKTNGGIQNVKICNLNEQQATFVISLMKNTRTVIDFKKELVKQFYSMRSFILEKHSAEWIKTRYHSKISRKAETDIIKQLVSYAENQGSKNADKLYMVYSRLANKIAGVTIRDNATINQLNNLSLIENILMHCIHEGKAMRCLRASPVLKELYMESRHHEDLNSWQNVQTRPDFHLYISELKENYRMSRQRRI